MKHRKIISICLVVLFLMALTSATAGQARAETRSAFHHDPSGAIVADLLVVRPLSLVATAAGGLIFVGTLPFTVWGGKKQVNTVGRHLVVNPALYFLERPVGRFNWEPEAER